MAKTHKYRQCTLTRRFRDPDEGGWWMSSWEVAWIPEHLAVVGEVLKIKRTTGWKDGWKVFHVGEERTVKEHDAAWGLWKRHRKATDLPKGTFKHE